MKKFIIYTLIIYLIIIIIIYSIKKIEKFSEDSGDTLYIAENILNFPIKKYITPEMFDFILGSLKKNNTIPYYNNIQSKTYNKIYLIDNKYNTEKSKLLCVVCNKTKLASDKNKVYKLFETGYKNDTLCYLKNLNNINIYYLFN